jgi:hypothetical protein
MVRRAALAVVAAVLVAGVSNAAGQQVVPTCIEQRRDRCRAGELMERCP